MNAKLGACFFFVTSTWPSRSSVYHEAWCSLQKVFEDLLASYAHAEVSPAILPCIFVFTPMLYRNLVTSLFKYEQIKTTLPKARDTARLAEKVAITYAIC